MDTNAAEQAIAHIIRMRQEAEELTKALGLPPEATYTVMAAMHKAKTSLVTSTQHLVRQSQAETSVRSDPRLEQVYQLSEGFLREHRKGLVDSLPKLWDNLKKFSLETLGGGATQRTTALAGLGAIGSNPTVPIISVISWWILKGSLLRRANAPDELKAIIARQAEERGCSRALSQTLAEYLIKR